jgi:hypothetical protein
MAGREFGRSVTSRSWNFERQGLKAPLRFRSTKPVIVGPDLFKRGRPGPQILKVMAVMLMRRDLTFVVETRNEERARHVHEFFMDGEDRDRALRAGLILDEQLKLLGKRKYMARQRRYNRHERASSSTGAMYPIPNMELRILEQKR